MVSSQLSSILEFAADRSRPWPVRVSETVNEFLSIVHEVVRAKLVMKATGRYSKKVKKKENETIKFYHRQILNFQMFKINTYSTYLSLPVPSGL